MTIQEAIKLLERMQEPEAYEPQITEAAFNALEMGIEALEKQIPMNHLAMEFDHDGRIIYPCGNCGSDVNGGDYCPWCGQRVGEM